MLLPRFAHHYNHHPHNSLEVGSAIVLFSEEKPRVKTYRGQNLGPLDETQLRYLPATAVVATFVFSCVIYIKNNYLTDTRTELCSMLKFPY